LVVIAKGAALEAAIVEHSAVMAECFCFFWIVAVAQKLVFQACMVVRPDAKFASLAERNFHCH